MATTIALARGAARRRRWHDRRSRVGAGVGRLARMGRRDFLDWGHEMSWTDALPAIGSFLAGPAGGLVGSGIEWLAEKLGASDKTVEGIKQTLAGMSPADLLEAKKIDIEFQKFCLDNNIKLQLAQIAVNQEEAKSSSFFVSGGRPFILWVCGVAFAYVAIVEPIARFIAQVGFHYEGAFPVIDTNLTLQVLGGLLGLGALRSWDKKNGTAL